MTERLKEFEYPAIIQYVSGPLQFWSDPPDLKISFTNENSSRLTISFYYTYSFRYVPNDFIPNPHNVEALKPQSGEVLD